MAKTQTMPPTGPRNAARQRAADAYRLRCTGRTFDEIAGELGYGSPAAAYNAIRKHIDRMPPEEADLARAFSAGNYRAVIAKLHDLADRCRALGRTTAEVQALTEAAAVQERHDKLMGLHIAVAQKVDVNVQHTAVGVIDRAKEELLALMEKRAPQLPVLDAEIIEEPR